LRTDHGNSDIDEYVSKQEGEVLAKEIGARAFVECTARDTDSVNNVFEMMTSVGVKYRKRRNNIVRKMFGR